MLVGRGDVEGESRLAEVLLRSLETGLLRRGTWHPHPSLLLTRLLLHHHWLPHLLLFNQHIEPLISARCICFVTKSIPQLSSTFQVRGNPAC